jgi:methyl-accepting chemotaxis protein
VTSTVAGVAGAAAGTGVAASHMLALVPEVSARSERLGSEATAFLQTVRAA